MIERIFSNPIAIKRWRRFKRNRRALFSVILLAIILFFSVTAEFWANSKPIYVKFEDGIFFPILSDYHPSVFGQEDVMVTNYRQLVKDKNLEAMWPLIPWDPYESNETVDTYPSKPTNVNWLGTDDRGRDIMSRILYGFRYSFVFAILVWALSFAVGTALGGIMGYFGGRVDLFGQRVVEILSTVPQFFLLIIVISIFGTSMTLLVALSTIFGWITISYYVRGEFLKNRKMDFADAARALGASHWRVIFRHILPNSMGPIITFSPFVIAANIISLASLDYLGFGLPPPTPSWGELLNQAQKYFTVAWWLAVYPSAALFLTLVALSLVGDGVKEALDPKRTR